MDKAMDKLESGLQEKRSARKAQFEKMQEMLMSGKVKDMTLEEQENFVELYKMLKQHHGFAHGGKVCRGRSAQGSAEKS